jgi:hypothetical protein
MYNRGLNGSRPSLPGQSTSTSTTSLYQPEYQAPPSSYPAHLPTDLSVLPTPAVGLSKTPSPLSNATSSTGEPAAGNAIDSDDVGLQMRSRQQPLAGASLAAAATSALPASSAGEVVNAAQLSIPAGSAGSNPTAASQPAAKPTSAVKKSKKELAKEAKEAKERQKAEEKQKAIDAARKKADDAREKMKREQQARAQKEADKKAAKVKAKQEKEQAKMNKNSAGKSTPTPTALVMPATPLKGRTKDLSAATPTTMPGTPVTPAEPVRLLDTASLAAQPANVKPSPLSAQPLTGSDLNDKTPRNMPQSSQTPRRDGPSALNSSTQSPAVSSVKSKRSFFGTLRRKFSSSPSPVASTRALSNGREGQSTPSSGPSGNASLLSVRQPETISEAPPAVVAQKSPKSSETSLPVQQASTDILTASPGVPIAEEEAVEVNEATTTGPALTGDSDKSIESKEAESANVIPVPQDGPEKPDANGMLANETEETIARMIDKAREGGLNVDLHVKYIQELDTVRVSK